VIPGFDNATILADASSPTETIGSLATMTELQNRVSSVRVLGGFPARLILAVAMMVTSALAAKAADCRDEAEPQRDWSGCNRSNIVLSGSNLEQADLHGADFSLSNLSDSMLKAANFEGAKLARTSLTGAIADGANFMQAEGYRTNFSGLSAKGASFRSAELQRSSFANATLTGVNFEKAELGRVDFTGAILGDNGFAFANLARATFTGAKISGPLDFRGAYLFLTRIEGIDLSTATDLVQAQIDLACGDAQTKLPSGLTPPTTWPCSFD
jgi:uncharacterized protein YjbI with pentapeptide repeats